MRSMIQRVARLEQAIGRGAEHPPTAIKISYVAPDGKVTAAHVITPGFSPRRQRTAELPGQTGGR